MNSFNMLPAGIRLDDAWPSSASIQQQPAEAPEIAELKEEFRRAMPEVAEMLETMAKLQAIQELTGRMAGPQPVRLVTHRS